jgi:hypothetical protein
LDVNTGNAGAHQVPEGVGRIVAAETFLISVDLENVRRVIGVMLEIWKRADQVLAALVEEKSGLNAR